MNYAIRFQGQGDVLTFLRSLCEEVASRLRGVGMVALALTLKIKQRAANAAEPHKFMGHGLCDNHTKSRTLPEPTDEVEVLLHTALLLLESVSEEHAMPPDQIRGVGIQMTRLTTKAEPELEPRTPEPLTHNPNPETLTLATNP
jgi:DNA repair protein REV1